MVCRRFEGQVGYQGQKYEVQILEHDATEWHTFGWQNEPKGGLVDAAKLWPIVKEVRIVKVKKEIK